MKFNTHKKVKGFLQLILLLLERMLILRVIFDTKKIVGVRQRIMNCAEYIEFITFLRNFEKMGVDSASTHI